MDVLGNILNNPIVLLAVGLIVKFVPGVRTVISNRLIPVLLTVIAWLGQIIGAPQVNPQPVSMDIEGLGGYTVGGIGFGFLGDLAGALWQTAQAWFLNEAFVRHFAGNKPKDSV